MTIPNSPLSTLERVHLTLLLLALLPFRGAIALEGRSSASIPGGLYDGILWAQEWQPLVLDTLWLATLLIGLFLRGGSWTWRGLVLAVCLWPLAARLDPDAIAAPHALLIVPPLALAWPTMRHHPEGLALLCAAGVAAWPEHPLGPVVLWSSLAAVAVWRAGATRKGWIRATTIPLAALLLSLSLPAGGVGAIAHWAAGGLTTSAWHLPLCTAALTGLVGMGWMLVRDRRLARALFPLGLLAGAGTELSVVLFAYSAAAFAQSFED